MSASGAALLIRAVNRDDRINDLEMVDLTIASWNRIAGWLSQLDALETTLAH
jgi:hypothetical protein